MNAQEIIELYGKSVYQIRLEAALRFAVQVDPDEALEMADSFVAALQDESLEEVYGKFR